MSAAAVSPWTRAGAIITCAFWYRRPSTFRMSRIAAPSIDVTMPILRGSAGSGRLRDASSRPSACRRRLSWSSASCRAPSPLGSISWQTIWYSPFGSYTLIRPRASTCCPSSSLNFSSRAAFLNITARSWAPASFSEK
jgi:hypothetical protein